MSSADEPRRALPDHPSEEHLRKEAKRLARHTGARLSHAQRQLARDYGFPDWAALIRRVRDPAPGAEAPMSPLSKAAAAGDVAVISRLLAEGHPADGWPEETATPLWRACASAPEALRVAAAERLLDAGASLNRNDTGATPLHAAARNGPLALVELLIRRGAVDWYPDQQGRPPLAWAKEGSSPDRTAIVSLLDRAAIADPTFRAAVDAIHAGDVGALRRLLDEHPSLLRERLAGPEAYRAASRQDYFRDPKLVWFVAHNPRPERPMPANVVEVARALLERGVEPADLDYTLELVMTSAAAREAGRQIPLMELLLDAGARARPGALLTAAAHRESAALEALLRRGFPVTGVTAAALGRTDDLRALLPACSADDLQAVLASAVINDQAAAARLALEAGADPNRFMPVHAHSLPLHQATANDNVAMLELLVGYGARLDVPDRLWNGAPLGWAKFLGRRKAEAFLERASWRLLSPPVTRHLDRAARARREDRYDEARAELEEARKIGETSGAPELLARVLKAAGQLERDEGRLEAALRLYEEAAAIQRRGGDPLALAHTLRHLGDIHHEGGRPGQALPLYREALALYRSEEAAPPLDLANAIRPLAISLEEMGEAEEAARMWAEARELYSVAGVVEGVAESAARIASRPSREPSKSSSQALHGRQEG